jgi:hypothetical protein
MFMVGYFIYDLSVVLIYFRNDWGSMVHHVCAIAVHIIICAKGICAFIELCFVVTEFSTPFVNNRFFFADAGMKERKRYVYNGIMMFITFLVLRIPLIGFIPYLFYKKNDQFQEFSGRLQILFLVMYCAISYLNGMWFYKITKGIIRTLAPTIQTKQKRK